MRFGQAWRWETSTEAHRLSQRRRTCRALVPLLLGFGEGGNEGPAIALPALGDPLTLQRSSAPGGTAARCQGPLPCWGCIRRAMAARACVPGSSSAGQVFSLQEFYPVLAGRASAVEYLLKHRQRGLPSYCTLPPWGSPPPPPKKEREAAPILGRRSVRVLPGGTSPPFQPCSSCLFPGCSWHPRVVSPSGGTPWCRGAVGPGGVHPQRSLAARREGQNDLERRSRRFGRARTACKRLDGGLIW